MRFSEYTILCQSAGILPSDKFSHLPIFPDRGLSHCQAQCGAGVRLRLAAVRQPIRPPLFGRGPVICFWQPVLHASRFLKIYVNSIIYKFITGQYIIIFYSIPARSLGRTMMKPCHDIVVARASRPCVSRSITGRGRWLLVAPPRRERGRLARVFQIFHHSSITHHVPFLPCFP